MIQGFYFRFYKLTHSERLSVFLSYLARFVYFLRFLFKRIFLKKENVEMGEDQALEILQRTSPDPALRPEYSRVPFDEEYDLSVIVPVYNHIDVLKRCLDSLVNQKTQYSYELILVDDGSTDGARKLVDQYESIENVRVIHQENGGIAAARNTGIHYARGRYLMFVDCDDYVHEDIVETLMTKAEKDAADIVMCAHALVKVKNGITISRLPNVYPLPINNMLGYMPEARIMNYDGLPWGKVYRRELFEGVRFFPGYWYEDTIIHSLIFTQCKEYTYIPEIKYEYQWYEKNFSHIQGGKKQLKAVDRYWLLKAILERYDELGLEKDEKFYTMLLKHVSAYYYPTVSSLSEDIIKAMFVVGRKLLLEYKPHRKIKLPYMLKLTERAIINNNIALWKLCSVNQ
ncbi:MAG: glycosyltransferase [Parasporobacterium sp.]|nr:glycosyltransferase [Parasporobacterium sp.]